MVTIKGTGFVKPFQKTASKVNQFAKNIRKKAMVYTMAAGVAAGAAGCNNKKEAPAPVIPVDNSIKTTSQVSKYLKDSYNLMQTPKDTVINGQNVKLDGENESSGGMVRIRASVPKEVVEKEIQIAFPLGRADGDDFHFTASTIRRGDHEALDIGTFNNETTFLLSTNFRPEVKVKVNDSTATEVTIYNNAGIPTTYKVPGDSSIYSKAFAPYLNALPVPNSKSSYIKDAFSVIFKPQGQTFTGLLGAQKREQ